MQKTHVRYPQGNVLLRNLTKNYPVADYAKGLYIFDKAGKKYIDAAGGALVMSLGHNNSELMADYISQIQKLTYVNGQQFTSEVVESFSTELVKYCPKGLDRVALLSSGSEANEAAFKFACQLWVERGQPKKSKIIARSPGYHGNTLYALSASARPHYQKLFKPLLANVPMLSAPYGYRFNGDYEKDGADFFAKEFESLIAKEGADTIAAFIFEPVVGSSAGGSTPPKGYFEKIQALCKKYEILMIADEVMCGSGRTGTFFACEPYDLQPDMITMGKGINSGIVPLSCLVVKGEHLDEMKKGTGYFMHAQTYAQSPMLAAAGLAVLKYIEKHKVLENAQKVGQYFQEQLREKLLPLKDVGNVAGLGLMAGVEFVKDKSSKAPFDRKEKFAENFVSKAFELGLILWPNVGQVDGVNGDLVMLGPPLNSTKSEIDEIIGKLVELIET